MYSVVQTKEKQKLVLTAVPSGWVIADEFLFWPTHIKNKLELDQLLKNPCSIPDLAEWKSQKCAVRANNIETYVLAISVEKAFLRCNDTDDEQAILKEMVRKQVPETVQASKDINNMLSELLEPEARPEDNNLNDSIENLEISKEINNVTKDVAEKTNKQPQTELNSNVTEIITEAVCLEVKKHISKLFEKLVRIETKLDEALKKMHNPLHSIDQEDMSIWCDLKFPVTKIEDVQFFNCKLDSTVFYKKMAEYLIKVTCSHDTKDTKKVTKKILTALFTLDLLRCYTWAGRGSKPAFSSLKKVLNLILDIEKLCDPSYNDEKSTQFLQNEWFKCLNQIIRRSEIKKSSIDDEIEKEANQELEVAIGMDGHKHVLHVLV